MNYQQALEQVVNEGAIRVFRLSAAWSIVYRLKNGQVERRDIQEKGEADWEISNHLVGETTKPSKTGWYSVDDFHPQAVPIQLEEAKANKGYYQELTRQCQTCKKEKPSYAFERDMQGEMGFRTWECNDCANERKADAKVNVKQASRRVGDYLTRKTHASKPPVESEI